MSAIVLKAAGEPNHIRSLVHGIELSGCKEGTVIAAEMSGH